MSATVCGVALHPGERVLYYRLNTPTTGQRVVAWIFGIVTLPFLIGLFLILFVALSKGDVDVITNYRLLNIKVRGNVRMWMQWEHLLALTRVRTGNGTLFFRLDGVMSRQVTLNWTQELQELVERGWRDPSWRGLAPGASYEP